MKTTAHGAGFAIACAFALQAGTTPETGIPSRPAYTEIQSKLGAPLAALLGPQFRAEGRTIDEVKAEMRRLRQIRRHDQVAQDTPYGPVAGDLVYVYVRGLAGASLDPTRGYFFEEPDRSTIENLWVGWVEESRLEALAALPVVSGLRAVHPPRFRTGSVTTAGDALHNASLARATIGLDGQPLKVAVISDGVLNLPLAVASGDLPPSVQVLGGNFGTGDEGTAMLEIIHDLAPGAQLGFCTSGTNSVQFQQNLLALVASGYQVVCDDVGWYQDSFFEDSGIGSFIAALRTNMPYIHVSAAGNDGQIHHQQTFTDTTPADTWHDQSLSVTIPPGASLDCWLQWDDPYGLSTTTDYDLYLHDAANMGGPPLGIGGATPAPAWPQETILFTNTTPSIINGIVRVRRVSGPARTLELFLEAQNGATVNPAGISAVDSIFGHPAHSAVIAVVSCDANNPSAIEPDSSQGPFTLRGQSVPRSKPDAAGIDNVVITGAGGFPVPFTGTSAAAPHVAATCALAWSRSPTVPPAAVPFALFMPGTCLDLGSAGYDHVFGWGRPLADGWALQFNVPPAVTTPTGILECAQNINKAIPGITVADADAGTASVTTSLTVGSGMLFLDPTIPGGLVPSQITGNGSGTLTVTAPQAALAATLGATDGLLYLNPFPLPPASTVTLTVAANDNGNTGLGGPLTAVSLATLRVHTVPYEAWRYENFDSLQRMDPLVSGPQADPDADTFGNAWEYFMAADPWTADPPGELWQYSSTATHLVFTFRIGKQVQPFRYAVRSSPDLAAWTDVPAGEITVPWLQHPSVPEAWLMEVRHPLGSPSGRDFLRLEFDPYR